MILFKAEHVEPIVEGRKTQTRRTGNKRWNVGAIHQCRTRLFDPESIFAHVQIMDVRREQLDTISRKDALAEGYENAEAYFAAFWRINGGPPRQLDVWVVRFKLASARSSEPRRKVVPARRTSL